MAAIQFDSHGSTFYKFSGEDADGNRFERFFYSPLHDRCAVFVSRNNLQVDQLKLMNETLVIGLDINTRGVSHNFTFGANLERRAVTES